MIVLTVYAQLKIDDAVVSDYSNYEVAAFVGDECRGVAEIQTKENSTWLYPSSGYPLMLLETLPFV